MSRRDSAPSHVLVWLIVVLAHAGLTAALLLSHPRPSRDRTARVATLSLLFLRKDSPSIVAPRFTAERNPALAPPDIASDLPPPPSLAIDHDAITLQPAERPQPRIDWEHESALAAQSSAARAAGEKPYRDLSSLAPDQLEWVKKNHMEPVPGFQWDRNSRGEMLRHGIVKLNDYCVLIVLIPFCRFGGKIQYNGDLFKDMREPRPLDR
jgi:hypothetical protein